MEKLLNTIEQHLRLGQVNEDELKSMYQAFEDVVQKEPQLRDRVLDLFKRASQQNNTPETLIKAYDVLIGLVMHDFEKDLMLQEVFWNFLRSDCNDVSSLNHVNQILGDFVKNKPESAFTRSAFTLFEISICSEKYTRVTDEPQARTTVAEKKLRPRRSLRYESSNIYDVFTDIMKTRPELASRALHEFRIALQLDKNMNSAVQHAYQNLDDIIQIQPQLAYQIFEMMERMFEPDKCGVYLLSNTYRTFKSIIQKEPQYADKVFELFNNALQADKNDAVTFLEAYKAIGEIIQIQPEFSNRAFDLLEKMLQSDKNGYGSLQEPYQIFGDIIIQKPEFANKAFELFEKILQSDKNDMDSLGTAYISLKRIVDQKPEFANKAFELFEKALQSDKNGYGSLQELYKIFGDIIIQKPEFTHKAFELLEKALQSDKNDVASLNNAYISLADIIIQKPELADKVFNLFEKALQSDENGMYSLGQAYLSLDNILDQKPEFANKAFELFEKALQSDRNGYDSLYELYKIFDDIITRKPEFANKAFELFEKALQSDENNMHSIGQAYVSLDNILDQKPEFAPKVLEMFKIGIQSDQNTYDMLDSVYDTLGKHVIKRPELAEQIFEVIQTGLQTYQNIGQILTNAHDNYRLYNNDNNDDDNYYYDEDNDDDNYHSMPQREEIKDQALARFYWSLMKVVEAKPDIAAKVLETAKSSPHSKAALYPYKVCMRYLPYQEMVAKYPEIEQYLHIAHKGRYTSEEEFRYVMNNFSEEQLLNTNIFSAQQRVMNVLVSTSAQGSGISKEEALNFRKPDVSERIKDYMESNRDWLIPASFKGAALFKAYFPSYIKTIQNHAKKNPSDALSIHDAVYWLPNPMTDDANARFANFIQRNIIYQNGEHKDVHRPFEELKIIAQNWHLLEKQLETQNSTAEIEKLKYNDVLSICMAVKYEDQRHSKFAVEATKHAVPEAQYHEFEDIYLAGLKVPEPFNSTKEFKEGKYTGRFLPRDDVRTGFFGDYTDCCQHFNGVGHSCAVSTVKDPFSQLFVIEDEKGKIIAGSWVWENTEGKYREVCFDNIESLGELQSRPEINKIYEQVGEYLTREENCHKVTIGLGYQDADVSAYKSTEAIALPNLYGDAYSDARSQVLLTENPNAKPLDKTQESQRYIRDVCFLDVEAMDRISDKVFPDSDAALQIPDDMSGLVIEDREKGVVGYCLYDKEQKEIYDMAVLPEYRTDKNASSGKLLLEMLKVVKKEGGQWHAELRDKTTLRYMEIMEKRGVVKLTKHGIDHEMSDGSKVVSVTFEPVKDEVRVAGDHVRSLLERKEENPLTLNKAANIANPDALDIFGGIGKEGR